MWSGEMAEDDGFKMLSLDAPNGPAVFGTTFTSSGTAEKDTFHDTSVVTEATRPSVFVNETDATLERKSAPTRTSSTATTSRPKARGHGSSTRRRSSG
jgi:hypothetical protein